MMPEEASNNNSLELHVDSVLLYINGKSCKEVFPTNKDHPLILRFPRITDPPSQRLVVPLATFTTQGYPFFTLTIIGTSFPAAVTKIMPFSLASYEARA